MASQTPAQRSSHPRVFLLHVECVCVGLAAVAIGSDLIKEPFRWDQRVFATVLKLPTAGC
jgi:hypothetical protein